MFFKKTHAKPLSLLLCLFLVGCMTETMHRNQHSYYKETVSSVLISEDNASLVIIGKKYHYILQNIETVSLILKSPLHKKSKLKFIDANVNPDNTINVSFRMVIKNPNQHEYDEAARYGFTKDHADMFLDIDLAGSRYLAGDMIPADKYQLNEQYSISISEPESGIKKAVKIAATPITAALDGALFLAHVPGLVLLLTFEDLR